MAACFESADRSRRLAGARRPELKLGALVNRTRVQARLGVTMHMLLAVQRF